jgi:hypothetical protein
MRWLAPAPMKMFYPASIFRGVLWLSIAGQHERRQDENVKQGFVLYICTVIKDDSSSQDNGICNLA